MQVIGFDKVVANLRKYGKEAEKDIEDATEVAARNIELYAKNNAPANFGDLGQSIMAVNEDKTHWVIVANNTGLAPYAAYVEFGTGGLVQVPNELKEQAWLFKGKGIKEVNLRARPYLYPALLRGRKEYLKALKSLLKEYDKPQQVY